MPAESYGLANLSNDVNINFFIWIATIDKKGCIDSYNYQIITFERLLSFILTRDNNASVQVSFAIRATLCITRLII